MKIAIFGAGAVGSSVAAALSYEQNDIIIFDHNSDTLNKLLDRLDISAVCGDASDPAVLRDNEINDVDMILAVTDSDATNIVVCELAHAMFNTPTKIARLRNPEFIRNEYLCNPDGPLHIDTVISPEQLVTQHIMRLIEAPWALQVFDFAGGKVQLAAIRAYSEGALVGHEIQELRQHRPHIDTRVVVIYRGDQAIIPNGHTTIEVNDEVFFIAAREHIHEFIQELRRVDETIGRRVLLSGAGNIGKRLATALAASDFRVILMERDKQKANEAAELLGNAIVLEGDSTDKDLMESASIEHTEVYCAVTNNDEANILSAIMAKKLGARRTMALVNKPAYADILETTEIDVVISPELTTTSELLKHIRRGSMVAVHSLRRGAAEAIEAVARGEKETSKVVGRAVDHLKLPPGVTVGAILRDDEVIIAHHDTEIESEDHIILVVVDKNRKQIAQIEKQFEVAVTYV